MQMYFLHMTTEAGTSGCSRALCNPNCTCGTKRGYCRAEESGGHPRAKHAGDGGLYNFDVQAQSADHAARGGGVIPGSRLLQEGAEYSLPQAHCHPFSQRQGQSHLATWYSHDHDQSLVDCSFASTDTQTLSRAFTNTFMKHCIVIVFAYIVPFSTHSLSSTTVFYTLLLRHNELVCSDMTFSD